MSMKVKGPRCLNHNEMCQGAVDYHTVGDRLKAFPRCEYHQKQREEAYENSIESEVGSDVPPNWFDESYAGETW